MSPAPRVRARIAEVMMLHSEVKTIRAIFSRASLAGECDSYLSTRDIFRAARKASLGKAATACKALPTAAAQRPRLTRLLACRRQIAAIGMFGTGRLDSQLYCRSAFSQSRLLLQRRARRNR